MVTERKNQKPMSVAKIAENLNRSTVTVWKELHQHNEDIKKFGYCRSCKRTGSEYATVWLEGIR